MPSGVYTKSATHKAQILLAILPWATKSQLFAAKARMRWNKARANNGDFVMVDHPPPRKSRYAAFVSPETAARLNELAQETTAERNSLHDEIDIARNSLDRALVMHDQVVVKGVLDEKLADGTIVPNIQQRALASAGLASAQRLLKELTDSDTKSKEVLARMAEAVQPAKQWDSVFGKLTAVLMRVMQEEGASGKLQQRAIGEIIAIREELVEQQFNVKLKLVKTLE